MSALPPPYGGVLRELLVTPEVAAELKAQSRDWPSWDLDARQLCDLELLATGACSPLSGFLGRKDYDSVVERMRLADGTLWPVPVVLDVGEAFARGLERGVPLVLRDPEGVPLAVMSVEDVWTPDREREARALYGSTDSRHPGAHRLLGHTRPVYVGGALRVLALPTHYDFLHLRRGPREMREVFHRQGWRRIVAFQNGNPLRAAHLALTRHACRLSQANLLLHPAVGMSEPGDAEHYTRVRLYERALAHHPEGAAELALLPLATRWAGPREALWHAIVRRNFGCTHFVVTPDHAEPPAGDGAPAWHEREAAQQLALAHREELGIDILALDEMVYVEDLAQYRPAGEVAGSARVLTLPASEFRRRLAEGLDIPEWHSPPDLVAEVRRTHPARSRQGVTVFFTGLSGAGKSTIANALLARLMEIGGRSVTLLDGDIVRRNLSSELGFSKEHRDLNIRRIGFVAAEITKHGGIAICAPIAPYAATRAAVRGMIQAVGGFYEVHVSTPIEVCESRDRKGLYAKARAGLIKEFTGVSDPYEAPQEPEIVIDTRDCSALEAAQLVLNRLEADGYIR
ncbi:MAG: bifunctional sulfate adenylyltransferase/adenylylsulfate kinase [Rhodocyclaceae bacterium]